MSPGLKCSSLRAPIRKTATERFIEKIKIEPILGCWLWQGALADGYAQFNVDNDREPKTGHIWAYKRFIGNIPEGLYCCHRCDVKQCVNPYHLFLGTQQDNIDDAVEKGLFKSQFDRTYLSLKLNEEKVREMRNLWNNGFTLTALVKKFDVDSKTVRNVLLRKTWKHVA